MTEQKPKKIVLFTIARGLQESDIDTVIRNVWNLQGVFNVAAVNPEAASARLRSEYYAELDNTADVMNIPFRINEISGVQSSFLPPQFDY